MSFTIKPATRQGVRPLIGLYSESGCGKTYSALLLARGFVGPTGKIVMADSESGRGSLYADVLPGGYDTLELTEPFSPERYVEAVSMIEKSGAAIGILDSASHSWEGLGGVTDMAMENERRSGKAGLHNWKEPKMAHAKFMLKLLQSPIPWIVCLRAKHKSRQLKGTPEMAESGEIQKYQIGKTIILKDEHCSPIQAEDFIYEMTAHAEILPDHSIRLTKCSHPGLRDCFPTIGPITSEHGQKIAQWANSAGAPSPVTAKQTKTVKTPPVLDKFKQKLWSTCNPRVGKTVPEVEAQLIAWNILKEGQHLGDLNTAEAISDAIDKIELTLNPPQ